MIYSINEGQQADIHRAKRAEEKEISKEQDKKYAYKGARTVTGITDKDGLKAGSEDIKRLSKAQSAVINDVNRRYQKDRGNAHNLDHHNRVQLTSAIDAKNRHMRRHPKQYKEGTIFESVEFI